LALEMASSVRKGRTVRSGSGRKPIKQRSSNFNDSRGAKFDLNQQTPGSLPTAAVDKDYLNG